MTEEEAKDFIVKHFEAYYNKQVFFQATGKSLVIKAIDVTKKESGEFEATCYTEDANEEDANFENGIFEHQSLESVIKEGKLIS